MRRKIFKRVFLLLFVALIALWGATIITSAQTTETFVWVMDTGDRIGEFNLIKMTPDGLPLWEVQFGQSLAISVDPNDGSVWAPELNDNKGNENQIVKLDAEGNVLLRIGDIRTNHLAVDPNDGSVWFGGVIKTNSDGEELFRVSGFGTYSIIVDPNDSSVWIGDGASNDDIVKLDSNGQELFRRRAPGFYSNCPQQIAIDPRDGSVWYTQGSGVEGHVVKLSSDGTFLLQVDGFDRPTSVSIDPADGSTWISNSSVTTDGAVVKLDQDGNELLRLSLGAPPKIVSVNPEDGSVWVGIEGSLIKLSSDGTILETLSTSGIPRAIITATVVVDHVPPETPEPVHIYELDGNFLDELGGPAISPNGSGFLIDGGYMVPDHGSGLSLRNAIDPTNYSIEMLVRLDGFPAPEQCVSGDHVCAAKIIDFKDLTADDGLVTPSGGDASDGRLQFFPVTDSPEGTIIYGDLIHLVLTRDGSTDQVIGYVNGLPVISFEDTVNLAVFDMPDNVVHFLMDDMSFVDDPPIGFIERIRIYADALTPEEVLALSVLGLEVEIDIKSGIEPNNLYCSRGELVRRGVFDVAILTSDSFDAASIDHTTVTFEGASEIHIDWSTGVLRRHELDVDHDGDLDLLFHFRLGDTDLNCYSTEGVLIGETFDGTAIQGADSVRMVNYGRKDACLPPPEGMVSWWPGEGNADDIADDNNGILMGDATFAPGMVGQAFSFDGDGDYVKVPRAPNLDPADQLTIELWMKADPSNPMDECCQGLVTTDFYEFAIAPGAGSVTGAMFAVNFVCSSDLGDGGYPLTPGEWYHLAGVYDGANVLLYVNGALVVDPPPQTGNIVPMLETSFLAIGSEDGRTNEPYLIGQRYFHGIIDEVSLYNRALSASEIEAIYNAGSTGKCSLP